MKRTPLKRGTKQMKRTPLRAKNRPKKKKREKLPTLKSVRNKCDNLLTPIIKKQYPYCLLCGGETQVAHHHVHKSKSTVLRYYLPNLINLCGSCHVKLHNNESYWASIVVQKRGMAWFEDLQREEKREIKVDVHFYIENYERLSKEL